MRNICFKDTDLESSFDEEYKDVLKINFESINLLEKANLCKDLL